MADDAKPMCEIFECGAPAWGQVTIDVQKYPDQDATTLLCEPHLHARMEALRAEEVTATSSPL